MKTPDKVPGIQRVRNLADSLCENKEMQQEDSNMRLPEASCVSMFLLTVTMVGEDGPILWGQRGPLARVKEGEHQEETVLKENSFSGLN